MLPQATKKAKDLEASVAAAVLKVHNPLCIIFKLNYHFRMLSGLITLVYLFLLILILVLSSPAYKCDHLQNKDASPEAQAW